MEHYPDPYDSEREKQSRQDSQKTLWIVLFLFLALVLVICARELWNQLG